jgi:hypothetical protein
MRTTTKLKQILVTFSLAIDMDDEAVFTLTLVEKENPDSMHTITDKTWSGAVSKAYGLVKKLHKAKN